MSHCIIKIKTALFVGLRLGIALLSQLDLIKTGVISPNL